MHIVVISRSYPNRLNPSSGNFVLSQVEALARHEVKIGVVGVYNVSLKEALKQGNINKYGFYKETKANVINYSYLYPVIPKQHYLNHRIKFRIWKKLFKKYIAEHGKPDIIHLHTFEAGPVVMWAKEEYGIPYIVTEHTSLFLTGKALDWHYKLAEKVYRNSELNISVSKAAMKDLMQRFNQEFIYLPNFVDTSKFQMKSSTNNGNHVFTNIAFLSKNKNQHLLIHAFHQAFRNDPKYKLRIIGNGPEYAHLKNEITKLDNSNIELQGYLPQQEIIKQLQSSDYFVLSSNHETFGVVIIEAMSCGLPVLSTACGGPESIIINEKLGLLSPVGDTKSFAQALSKLCATTFDHAYIRDYAVNNYSFEVLSKKLLDIYKELLQ